MSRTEARRKRIRRRRGVAIWILLGLPAAIALPVRAAEMVYVTDELRLGLFGSESTNGRPIKTLVSGAELTVLERSLMSIRVRTEDGEEGWVKTAYIVAEEPGRRRAARLEAGNIRLEEEKAALAANLAKAQARIEDLESEVAAATTGIAELPALKQDYAALEAEIAARGRHVPLAITVAGIVLALVLGGIAGYAWLDRKVRSHFGGIRPY